MDVLRDYQSQSKDGLRDGIRAGLRKQILCAPTGAGKTVIAASLMQDVHAKQSRAVFIVDRVSLIDQTSATFDSWGIPHGVIQAQHWRCRPYERIQVASVQTLARRGVPEDINLVIVDEAHTLYKTVKDIITGDPELIVIGLTATPFTKGLSKLYQGVVNVTTTNKLIDSGWLSPVRSYACKAINMKGAKVKNTGEWEDSEMEQRGLVIIGDIVSEWVKQTREHFGGPVKTLVFSATVAHGQELCRQFSEQGHNFQQISYLDGNDDSRRALIEEFRKSDSEIVGLVACEVLSKGFDVPDVMCGISAKPYRRSLSAHIQQLGRVMRPHESKKYALWLDHSGNYLRFRDDMEMFFESGVDVLDDGELDAKVRKEAEDEEKEEFLCARCRYVMGGSSVCPCCGWERPQRKTELENVPGEMHEITRDKNKNEWLDDRTRIMGELWGLALERKQGDEVAAKRFYNAQYKNLYGSWPGDPTKIEPLEPSTKLRNKVKQQLIRFFKSKEKAAA